MFLLQLYTVSGTVIPLTSVEMSGETQARLKSEVLANQSITLNGIGLEVELSTSICREIEESGCVKHSLVLVYSNFIPTQF